MFLLGATYRTATKTQPGHPNCHASDGGWWLGLHIGIVKTPHRVQPLWVLSVIFGVCEEINWELYGPVERLTQAGRMRGFLVTSLWVAATWCIPSNHLLFWHGREHYRQFFDRPLPST